MTASATAPVWATLLAGLGAGTLGTGLGAWQTRRLIPAERTEIETNAARAAVETVHDALSVANGRIESLQGQVTEAAKALGELRAELRAAQASRARTDEALTLTLSDRAKLQQQVADLNRRVGARRMADLGHLEEIGHPDAIVMVSVATGEICYANEGVFTMFGYTPSQVVGSKIEMLVPDAERAAHQHQREAFNKAPAQRQMGSGLDLFARTASGEKVRVDISLHPTGDGRIIALIKHRGDPSSSSDRS